MARARRIVISIVLILFSLSAKAQWDFTSSGYVKGLGTFNRLNLDPYPIFIQNQLPELYEDYQIHNRFNFNFYYGSSWHANVGMRNRLFWGWTARNTPSMISDLEEDAGGLMDLSHVWMNSTSAIHTIFDRAWFEYDNTVVRVRLGRQRINWGINTIWNPNDLFNQYNFFDFDYEERPGVDAALVQLYTSSLSSIQLAYSPNIDEPTESVGAAMYKINVFQYDFQLLAGYFKRDLSPGLGWAGSIGNMGFKGEAQWFIPWIEDDMGDLTEPNTVVSVGLDYSLINGLFMQGGYLYNQAGSNESSIVGSGILSSQTLSAKNIFPYKNTAFIGFSYPITPLLTVDLTTISSTDLVNVFLVPSLSYSLHTNLDILLLGQVFWGDVPLTNQNDFLGSSYFLRLKYSF